MMAKSTLQRLKSDWERFLHEPLPKPLWQFVLERYGVDLRSNYAGFPVPLLVGKASGQLSMELHQVRMDGQAGLGFCVLKTVIAQDAQGNCSMKAWAIPVTKMKVERIRGRDGTEGWTVTWIGRGWHKSFTAYLRFFEKALAIGAEHDMLIVPSIKAHLPASMDEEWRIGEYDFTVGELLKVWRTFYPDKPMPLEFDFSPTLAGKRQGKAARDNTPLVGQCPETDSAGCGESDWFALRTCHPNRHKVFNALFDDSFQLEMLLTLLSEAAKGEGADFIVYANRLFDPNREFEGVKGIAYGGPDLSARNLKVLSQLAKLRWQGSLPAWLPISGTGNVCNGEIAFRYLSCGCTTLQIHTFFQLPLSCYAKRTGSRIERALHQLLFDPDDGLLARLLMAKERLGIEVLTIDRLTRQNWSEVSLQMR
jgi:hypothetical protein